LLYSKDSPQLQGLSERDEPDLESYNSDQKLTSCFKTLIPINGLSRSWQSDSITEPKSTHEMPKSDSIQIKREGKSLLVLNNKNPESKQLGCISRTVNALNTWDDGRMAILIRGISNSCSIATLDPFTLKYSAVNFTPRGGDNESQPVTLGVYPTDYPNVVLSYFQNGKCFYDLHNAENGAASTSWQRAFTSDISRGRAAIE